MKNLEMIDDIFNKTKSILNLWKTEGVEYNDNPQVSHILYYLSLTAGYLKGKKEAKIFEKNWNEIKDTIKSGSDQDDWLNQGNMIRCHLEQALAEESVHNPKSTLDSDMNIGIARFYENTFPKLYEEAKKERDEFNKKNQDYAKSLQKHHAEVFATQESWEEALRRGDPMALVD
jgi:hypothetical protein